MTLPDHLRPETLAWCQEILTTYELETHHVKLLVQAGECWDRICEARERIEAEGSYYLDRFGQPRAHPALNIEKDNRVIFARLIRELNLDPGTPENRPPALRY